MTKHAIESVDAMQALAATVASKLHGGEIVLLFGELGSGKTTFSQGLAKALGVALPVTSPTFTIVSDYPVSGHPTIRELYHADLYRFNGTNVGQNPLVADLLEQSRDEKRLTVIEWAERLGKLELSNALRLTFEHDFTNEALRHVTIDQ